MDDRLIYNIPFVRETVSSLMDIEDAVADKVTEKIYNPVVDTVIIPVEEKQLVDA